jgi:hypothetical protein
MDEFSLQLKLLKFSGFIRYGSGRTKMFLNILLYCIYILSSYFWFSSAVCVYKSDDVLNISEALAPTFTGIFTTVKYIVFQHYYKDFYDAMDLIEDLNKKCNFY